MKVVFITVGSPFGKGEAFIAGELEQIRLVNNDIAIFPLREQGACSHDRLLKYVIHFRQLEKFAIIVCQLFSKFLKIANIILWLARLQKPKRFLYTLYILPRTLLLVSVIEKRQIIHIHAYWGSTPATCALIAHELTGIDFSLTIHRADIVANDLLALKSQKAVFVRSISEFGKKMALQLGAAKEKIHIIHMGVQLPSDSSIHISKKPTISLISVANLIKIKRIDQLIIKIAGLPDTNLTVVGDGPQKNQLKKIIRKLSLERRVKLSGHISQNKLFSLYRQGKFDLFVLPSSIEGIPVSAIEAMAYRIPVALTNVGGNRELINNSNGYFLSDNLDNLEEVIRRIPEQDKIAHARKLVEQEFSSKKNAAGLLQLILKYETRQKN